LNVGFIIYDRQGLSYDLKGNKVERTFTSAGIGLNISEPNNIDRNGENITTWIEKLPIYLPTVRLSAITSGSTSVLTAEHNFDDYFKKVTSMTFLKNKNNEYKYILTYNNSGITDNTTVEIIDYELSDKTINIDTQDENNENNNE
jgi:hypothetical protein